MAVQGKKKALSIFALTMITVGSVDSIRNLPATALFGSQLIIFFLIGAIVFLIPCALVSAELSSTFPKEGGIYVWIKKAFGPQLAFLAIWLQWIENVIWYPALLAFVAGSAGYLINPALADNKFFLMTIILLTFWGATLVNLKGMDASAFLGTFCTITGLLIPMALIIGLGTYWYLTHAHLEISFTYHSLKPKFDDPNVWVSLTAVILSFCGIEIATVHANDVKNPQRAFPVSLMLSVIIIMITLMLGSLAIAIVLPHNKISLVAGIMQAFEAFLSAYHLSPFMPLIAIMLILGGIGSVNNWIIAPTKGLLVAANDGHLPKHFQKTNQHNAPTTLLIYQAIIVSLLSLAFVFMPTINSAYWLLTALASQLYMLMYLLMFLAMIKVRINFPKTTAKFKIPGGLVGVYIISILGLIGAGTTLAVSFIPPDIITKNAHLRYESSLIIGLVLMSLPPLVLKRKEKNA